MDEKIKNAVEEYQCPGCVVGLNITCYEKGESEACQRHAAGTTGITSLSFEGNHPIFGSFSIFLGMPKGFNRPGSCGVKIHIFKELKDGWSYDKFNIPVWKYKDKNGNVFVRGLSPRINSPFLHIFLTDCLKEIDCLEITENDLNEMD